MIEDLRQRPYGGQVHVDRVHGCRIHPCRTVGMVIPRAECQKLINSIRKVTSPKSVNFVTLTLFVKTRDGKKNPYPHITVTRRPDGKR